MAHAWSLSLAVVRPNACLIFCKVDEVCLPVCLFLSGQFGLDTIHETFAGHQLVFGKFTTTASHSASATAFVS